MTTTTGRWPVLTEYDQEHVRRVALPLGGIGTGTVSLGGRGNLFDWEIMNRPAKGAQSPQGAFFALYARAGDAEPVTRALEGVIDPADYEGASGCPLPNHGLPRFRECRFAAAYPFGQVLLSDDDVPVDVRLEAFNPLVPADADASGFPAAVLRYVLTNKTGETVTAAVCGTVPNFINAGGVNRNVARAATQTGAVRGVLLTNQGGNACAEQYGTIALTTTARDLTCRTGWVERGWGGTLLDFWDDFSADGRLDERAGVPHASVAAGVRIPPHGEQAVTFIIAWHFPNRQTWTPVEAPAPAACCCGSQCDDPNRVGNYYCTQFADAWAAAETLARHLDALEAKTLAFVRAFCAADLPAVVKEAALYNLSTLRSQTCFRTEDGHFFGWEGCGDGGGCCHGSCTHVWNYEQATAFLFGALSRDMRVIEFAHATRDEDGLMCFRVGLPLDRAQAWPVAAADGQLGCLMKLYRDWQLSGDTALLRALWPKAKKALEFCWIPNGWDGDRDGVMEGCQHNTMDVEYYGPNGQMSGWYLGALRAGEAMARAMGDDAWADRCRALFTQGRAWVEAHLFNGEFYEHEVRPPLAEAHIAPGLRAGMGGVDWADPPFQLGQACLVDQLVGQYMAHVCGLGYLLDPEHVRTTLRSIMRYNFRVLRGHFNNMRTYALQEESALLMATYPRGHRPQWPFPYFNEVMTGFEYTAAVHMLYEGLTEDGLRVIAAVRARYDGKKRSPFDEAECGHHYARAMASWAAVLALTGFRYSGLTGTLTLAAQPGVQFWSTGDAWGDCVQHDAARATLRVLHGVLRLSHFTLTGAGSYAFPTEQLLREGAVVEVTVE